MFADADGRLPNLTRWLAGIDSHVLQWYIEQRRNAPRHPAVVYQWWENPYLVVIEETLAILENAKPDGIDGRRRIFRTYRGTGGPNWRTTGACGPN